MLMFASRAMAMKTSAAARIAEHERSRHLDVLRQIESRRRQFARLFDQRLECRETVARCQCLGTKLLASGAELVLDVAARRVQLGCELDSTSA